MTSIQKSHGVSVIIPYYNGGKWIHEAIASLIYGNESAITEIVVVNDGSDAEQLPPLVEASKLHPAIRVINHERNLGGAAARNRAVSETSKDWIYCLDADNLAPPGLIHELHDCALAKKLDVCTPEFSIFFNEEPINATHVWQYRATPIELIDHFACAYVPSASGNYLFSRESFNQARGYPVFSRSLDTWGFGLRQVATGAKMSAAKGTHYLHRYGHDSYWVRESKKENLSLTATSLVLPFSAQLPEGLIKRIMGRRRETWFEQLASRPIIKTRNVPAGRLLSKQEADEVLKNLLGAGGPNLGHN